MGKYLASYLFAVTAAMSSIALGKGADVALVNLVSGDVTYAAPAEPSGSVRPFMKVREGDRIDVAAGGQVRIVFFEGARQELWAGPASFRAGKRAAEPISGKPLETTSLPQRVPQHLARIPELIQSSKLGGSQLRGLPRRQTASGAPQTTLVEARAAYEKMRQDMPADDITPELYLYAELHELLAYEEMKAVVADMRRRQPGNEDAKVFDEWLTNRTPR